MGEANEQGFAKEVRDGEVLVSRWAVAQEKPKESSEPAKHASNPTSPKPSTKESELKPKRDEIKPTSRLESKWAKAAPTSASHDEHTQANRRGGAKGHSKQREPANSNRLGNQSQVPEAPVKTPQKMRSHHHHSHEGPSRYPNTKHHHTEEQNDKLQQSWSSNRGQSANPHGNKLAEHLGISPEPRRVDTRSKKARRPRSAAAGNSAANIPAKNLNTVEDSATVPAAAVSTWSLDGYDSGEDWAAAEEEEFNIQVRS